MKPGLLRSCRSPNCISRMRLVSTGASNRQGAARGRRPQSVLWTFPEDQLFTESDATFSSSFRGRHRHLLMHLPHVSVHGLLLPHELADDGGVASTLPRQSPRSWLARARRASRPRPSSRPFCSCIFIMPCMSAGGCCMPCAGGLCCSAPDVTPKRVALHQMQARPRARLRTREPSWRPPMLTKAGASPRRRPLVAHVAYAAVLAVLAVLAGSSISTFRILASARAGSGMLTSRTPSANVVDVFELDTLRKWNGPIRIFVLALAAIERVLLHLSLALRSPDSARYPWSFDFTSSFFMPGRSTLVMSRLYFSTADIPRQPLRRGAFGASWAVTWKQPEQVLGMSLDPTLLFLSLIPGGIGFVLFVYGKKQERSPQLVAGLL